MKTEIVITLVVQTLFDGDPEDGIENAALAGTLQQAIEEAAPGVVSVESVALQGYTPLTQEPRFCVDGDDQCITLSQFRKANQHDPELGVWCAQISKLTVGKSVTFGGGAAAETVVKRVR